MLDSITVEIQWETVMITMTHYYFNIAISNFTELAQCLQKRLPTEFDVAFGLGTKQTQQNHALNTSIAEIAAVERLKKRSEDITVSGDSELLAENTDKE